MSYYDNVNYLKTVKKWQYTRITIIGGVKHVALEYTDEMSGHEFLYHLNNWNTMLVNAWHNDKDTRPRYFYYSMEI